MDSSAWAELYGNMTSPEDLYERDMMNLRDAAVEAVRNLRQQYPQFDAQTVTCAVFDSTAHALSLGREGITAVLNALHASYRIGEPAVEVRDDA